MKQLSSIDLNFLVREFNLLEGGKINQIYSFGKKSLCIDIYSGNLGRKYLTIENCEYVYISQNKKSSQEPSNFCMYLRKKLKNNIIKKIEQYKGERILIFELEGKKENNLIISKLVIELFAKGNIIFTDQNDMILGITQKQVMSDRAIKHKEIYEFPKNKLDHTKLTSELLLEEIKNKELVKTLASIFSMGGVFSEEICKRVNIDKNTTELSLEDANLIIKEKEAIINSNLDPHIVFNDENTPIIITPIKLDIYEEYTNEKIESLSQGYEQILGISKREVKEDQKLKKYNDKIEQVKNKIQDQESHIESLGEISTKNQEIGNNIYENYTEINELLQEINIKWKSAEFEELKKEYKTRKYLKSIQKQRKIIVEV